MRSCWVLQSLLLRWRICSRQGTKGIIPYIIMGLTVSRLCSHLGNTTDTIFKPSFIYWCSSDDVLYKETVCVIIIDDMNALLCAVNAVRISILSDLIKGCEDRSMDLIKTVQPTLMYDCISQSQCTLTVSKEASVYKYYEGNLRFNSHIQIHRM